LYKLGGVVTRAIIAIVAGYCVNVVGVILAAILPLAVYKGYLLSKNPYLKDGGWYAVTLLASTLGYRIILVIESGLLAFFSGIIVVKLIKNGHKNPILIMAALSSFSCFLIWSRFYPSLIIGFLISLVTFFFVILGAAWSEKAGIKH
jgi:hypothetical protein